MTPFNKRNAMIGWLVLTFGKPVLKQGAKSMAGKAKPGKRRGIIAGSAAAAGATVGGVALWRKRHKEDESFEGEESFES
jgi:hypothetical protein